MIAIQNADVGTYYGRVFRFETSITAGNYCVPRRRPCRSGPDGDRTARRPHGMLHACDECSVLCKQTNYCNMKTSNE